VRRGLSLLGFIIGAVIGIIIGALILAGIFLLALGSTISFLDFPNCHCTCETINNAGPIKEIGAYNATSLIIEDVIGTVKIKPSNEPQIKVLSNLPINVSVSEDSLVITCSECREKSFKNGEIILMGNLSSIKTSDILGRLIVEVPTKRIEVGDVLGEVNIQAYTEVFESEDILGRAEIKATREVQIEDVIGEVKITIPKNSTAKISYSKIIGKIADLSEDSNKIVKVDIEDILGELTVENEK